jgi:hypothetical protein
MASVTPLVLKPTVLCVPELSKFRKTIFVTEFIHSDRVPILTKLFYAADVVKKLRLGESLGTVSF